MLHSPHIRLRSSMLNSTCMILDANISRSELVMKKSFLSGQNRHDTRISSFLRDSCSSSGRFSLRMRKEMCTWPSSPVVLVGWVR